MLEQRVDHRVSDEVDGIDRDALAVEILDRAFRVDEKDRAEVIRELAVELFGHGRIEAPKARLDMRDRHVELRGGECRTKRRVDIAEDDYELRSSLQQHLLHRNHCPRGLLGVGSRTHSEMLVRSRETELFEEDIGHLRTVVLA